MASVSKYHCIYKVTINILTGNIIGAWKHKHAKHMTESFYSVIYSTK